MKHFILLSTLLATGTLVAQRSHQITLQNDVFYPEFLVVEAGDPIDIQIHGDNTITEVSAGTFRAGGTNSNGSVHIGQGAAFDNDAATFTLDQPGEYFFVSEGRNTAAAKMQIVVITATNTGISANADQFQPQMFPNPADDHVRFPAHAHLDMMTVQAFDQSGRLVMQDVVRGNEPLNLMSLPTGHYTLRLTDGMSTVYGVERLVINRKRGGA